jgi:competence ComEA-like helix-hairpin-helix protein
VRPSLFFFSFFIFVFLFPFYVLALKIDINFCSAKDLEALPGIGPKLAQRIIEYREIHGGFKALEELKQVKGIGEKKFEKIRPYIFLSTSANCSICSFFSIYYFLVCNVVFLFTHFALVVP